MRRCLPAGRQLVGANPIDVLRLLVGAQVVLDLLLRRRELLGRGVLLAKGPGQVHAVRVADLLVWADVADLALGPVERAALPHAIGLEEGGAVLRAGEG